MGRMQDVEDAGCRGCRMQRMQDAEDAGCSRALLFFPSGNSVKFC
jgi:hypothetical protein